MNRKNKIIIGVVLGVVLVIGMVVLVTITTTPATKEDIQGKQDTTKNERKNGGSSATASKDIAEQFIDDTVSQDKLKEEIGEWKEFEMNSNGCERGVYAGIFYYEDFTVFSRTYDKGKTFRIVSVNE